MPQQPAGPERSIAEVLRRRAADTPDRRAFLWLNSDGDEGPALSYGELDAQARRVASRLRQVTEPGDRALLLYAPGLEFIPAFFGCLYAGLIAVPAFPPRPDRPWQGCEGLERLAENCRPRVVLTGGELAASIEQACRGSESLMVPRWLNTDDLDDAAGPDWSHEAESPSAICHLQYTSGSTGTPKGVAISHGNLMDNEHQIAMASGHHETAAAGICGVTWLPFQHDLGLVAGLLQAVFVGGPLVMMSPLTMLQRPFIWLDAISKYRAHTSAGPNFAFDLCVRRLDDDQIRSLDLRSWKIACIGAEPVRPSTLGRFSERFADAGFAPETFLPSYGLAEATLLVTCGECAALHVEICVSSTDLERGVAADSRPGEIAGRSKTLVGCGRSPANQQLLIVDPANDAALGENLVGEICVTGPSIAQGYWGRPDETERVLRSKLPGQGPATFLRTGDLGFLRKGELYLTGRLKDLLIVRGQNHYPHDIEQTVQNVDATFPSGNTVAFQVDSGDEPRLVVLQEVGRRQSLDPASLVREIRRTVTERHGIDVDDIVFVRRGNLPKTTSGKIQRFACRTAYEAGRLPLWTQSDATR